jgi:integral membrane sensor domain MASE1
MTTERIANIGPRGILRRRLLGIVALTTGGALAVVRAARDLSPLWLPAVAFLYLLAGLGIFQAREKT